MQCLKRAPSLGGDLSRQASAALWPHKLLTPTPLPSLFTVTPAHLHTLHRPSQPQHTSPLLHPTPLPTPLPAPLHTSAPLGRIPPKDTREWALYYTQKIQIQQAKKTGAKRPVAHKFYKGPRTFNVRVIPGEEEARRRHDALAGEVIGAVNEQLKEGRQGRLFAGVRVAGKEFHVKAEDLVVVQGRWAPEAGDLIRLEKVLYCGGRDFTLFGRPLLPPDQCCVEATVVEKTLSHTTIWFKNRPKKTDRLFKFHRVHLTVLRINGVSLLNAVDELPEVEGVEGTVFGAEA